jgi:hypothetical protein
MDYSHDLQGFRQLVETMQDRICDSRRGTTADQVLKSLERCTMKRRNF